jgi:hypothetical protein
MPRAGYEPMIPVFERLKTVHALHLAAIETGIIKNTLLDFFLNDKWIRSEIKHVDC